MAIIKTTSGSVTLVNGRATFRYTLQQPTPLSDSTVDINITPPIDLSGRVNIGKAGVVIPPDPIAPGIPTPTPTPTPTPAPKPTDGFEIFATNMGVAGKIDVKQVVTGTFPNNLLDGAVMSIYQVINYQYANGKSSYYQDATAKVTVANGKVDSSFNTHLAGTALTNAGSQAGIFRITYWFTFDSWPTGITPQRGWQKGAETYIRATS